MTYKEFLNILDKKPAKYLLDLCRKHGFSQSAPDFKDLLRTKKEELNISHDAPLEAVLFLCEENEQKGTLEGEECYAVWLPIQNIFTDPKRFQNRNTAFSEMSAEAVAKNFDKNKFDAIVVWVDPKNKKTYVLSGHSRYEGMKRRGEKQIPVRYFEGTEAEAIQFAKVDANRSANVENLVEDLKAYVLMRDGDASKGLKPASKKELHNSFRGKVNKLEAYSYLNPGGKFILTLGQENKTEYPFIERLALWVGEIRKENPDMTNTHEEDCFNYLYRSDKSYRVEKDDFVKEVEKRLSWGKARLFPECDNTGCRDIKDLNEVGEHKEWYKRLTKIAKEIAFIRNRFKTTDEKLKIYTKEEKEAVKAKLQQLLDEQARIKRDLNILENEVQLFGNSENVSEISSMKTEEDFAEIDELINELKGIETPYQTMAAFAIAHQYMLNPKEGIKSAVHLATRPDSLNKGGTVADVSFYEGTKWNTYQTKVVIEIEQPNKTRNVDVNEDRCKLLFARYEELEEVFLYELEITGTHIQANRWRRISKSGTKETGYSDFLQVDLSTLFDPKSII